MSFSRPVFMTLGPAGCPDCAEQGAISVKYAHCDTEERPANDVIFIFQKCNADYAPSDPTAPTVAEIIAVIDSGDAVAKLTERFSKGASDIATRDRGYKPAKPISKTHNFAFFDTRVEPTEAKHRTLWNEILDWAEAESMNIMYCTENDELYPYVVDPQNVTLSVDDTQEPGEGVIEELSINVSVKTSKNYIVVPYIISGLYAALKAKTNAVGVTLA